MSYPDSLFQEFANNTDYLWPKDRKFVFFYIDGKYPFP